MASKLSRRVSIRAGIDRLRANRGLIGPGKHSLSKLKATARKLAPSNASQQHMMAIFSLKNTKASHLRSAGSAVRGIIKKSAPKKAARTGGAKKSSSRSEAARKAAATKKRNRGG